MTKKRNHATRITVAGLTYLSAKELAPALGLSEHALRRLARSGKVPARKVGSKLWFVELEVRSALGREYAATPAPVHNFNFGF